MELLTTKALSKSQKTEIFNLWNTQFPVALVLETVADFESFLQKSTNHFHIIFKREKIEGWIMVFERDSESWFSIIVSPMAQGKGLGKRLLNEAKKHFEALNGWVVNVDTYQTSNGTPYKSPMEFYLKNGFKISEGVFPADGLSAVKIRWERL